MIGVSPDEGDDNAAAAAALSSEDPSCSEESVRGAELDLALGLGIGWPPLRTYRINSLFNNQANLLATEDDVQKGTTKNSVKKDGVGFIKSPMLVKVTMDGVIIGRKIDLSALDSYEALAKTLEQMFFHTPSSETRVVSELLDGSSEHIITYQDKDGDWMRVRDVPWRMFFGSVKRLRIMRRSGETGSGK
ncbi:unnamed protein product [Eruca vesicaria subsp. sativa]|uniref:Auxin-responsive protein n=1 Tax=Eruca vesicaria subsp. sativa TaxID=29727 RepID=A0ABC8KYC7_ERUVS|nr:unnamed protein product [Eruca vesicaria subsp. sativa]